MTFQQLQRDTKVGYWMFEGWDVPVVVVVAGDEEHWIWPSIWLCCISLSLLSVSPNPT